MEPVELVMLGFCTIARYSPAQRQGSQVPFFYRVKGR